MAKKGNKSVEKELLELENSYWQAIKDRDFEHALELTDDPCIVAGPQGVTSIDKETFRNMINAEQYSVKDFKIRDAKVRMLTDDVAVLAYKVHEELTTEGEDLTIEVADCSTWVRRDGHWVCSMHSEAILGDPFGRDRAQIEKRA